MILPSWRSATCPSTHWHLGASDRHSAAWHPPDLPHGHLIARPQFATSRRWCRARSQPRNVPLEDVNSWRMPEFNPPGDPDGEVAWPASPSGPPTRSRSPSPGPVRRKKSFEERYDELTLYYMKHGHCLVPVNDPSGLGGWVAYQRRLWKAGGLPLERYHALAALGFQFDAFDTRWAARFRQLSEFHSHYGHCLVPAGPHAEAQWPGLRQWTVVQRQLWKRGLLDDQRVRRLSGLSFVWQLAEARWEERFAELVAFKQEHGHCNVPKGWAANQGLASWVDRIRSKWRAREGQRALSHSRESRLRELGFVFEPLESCWEERYQQLQEVLQQEGHLGGPFPNKGRWAGLAEWVARQRHRQREGRLHPDRQQALDELGFVWDLEEASWAEKLRALDRLLARVGPQMAWALLEGAPASQRVAAPSNSATCISQPAPSGPEPLPGPLPTAAQQAPLGTAHSMEQQRVQGRQPPAMGSGGGGGGNGKKRRGQQRYRPSLTLVLEDAAGVAELVRWYRGVRRKAGELSEERLAQLVARGAALAPRLQEVGGEGQQL